MKKIELSIKGVKGKKLIITQVVIVTTNYQLNFGEFEDGTEVVFPIGKRKFKVEVKEGETIIIKSVRGVDYVDKRYPVLWGVVFSNIPIKMDPKQQAIMDFLHRKVFDPILTSPNASAAITQRIRFTKMQMKKLPAPSMIQFFWDAVDNNGVDNINDLLKQQGLPRFTEPGIAKEFGEKFTDAWLGNCSL